MTWRPPSARSVPDDRFDRLHEGVSSWLKGPLIRWVADFVVHHSPMEMEPYYDIDVIQAMDLGVRFNPPLPAADGRTLTAAILQRFHDDSPEAIDVLDFLLHRLQPLQSWATVWEGSASELKRILDNGGSVWDVTLGEEDENDLRRYQLTRRVAGPVVEAIEAVGSVSERAGQHLNEAWTQLLGTHPDPSAAYQAAVAAVEVAAKPVISPNDQAATLGTMRGQLRADVRDHPSRWTFELGDDAELVVSMITALWENQLRHGDEAAPLRETQEQADAAVNLAITLVRWFTTGAVRRA
jgi:hypothetical protein